MVEIFPGVDKSATGPLSQQFDAGAQSSSPQPHAFSAALLSGPWLSEFGSGYFVIAHF